jgi:hypothetical protein
VSNRRKIDLPKLAAALAGVKPAPPPRAPAPTRPAFPRVSAERIEELLDDAETPAGAALDRIRLRATPAGTTMRYQGRPQC